MEFVLDDQGRRKQAGVAKQLPSDARLRRAVEAVLVLAIDVVEEGADLIDEWQARKLVHRRDEKRWQAPVNGLVDGQDRQGLARAEWAARVRAANLHVLRCKIARCAAEAITRERFATPRAGFDRGRGLTA